MSCATSWLPMPPSSGASSRSPARARASRKCSLARAPVNPADHNRIIRRGRQTSTEPQLSLEMGQTYARIFFVAATPTPTPTSTLREGKGNTKRRPWTNKRATALIQNFCQTQRSLNSKNMERPPSLQYCNITRRKHHHTVLC